MTSTHSPKLDNIVGQANRLGLEVEIEHLHPNVIQERKVAVAIKRHGHFAGQIYLYLVGIKDADTHRWSHYASVMNTPKGSQKITFPHVRSWLQVLAR